VLPPPLRTCMYRQYRQYTASPTVLGSLVQQLMLQGCWLMVHASSSSSSRGLVTYERSKVDTVTAPDRPAADT
jgi:hypothetical protein